MCNVDNECLDVAMKNNSKIISMCAEAEARLLIWAQTTRGQRNLTVDLENNLNATTSGPETTRSELNLTGTVDLHHDLNGTTSGPETTRSELSPSTETVDLHYDFNATTSDPETHTSTEEMLTETHVFNHTETFTNTTNDTPAYTTKVFQGESTRTGDNQIVNTETTTSMITEFSNTESLHLNVTKSRSGDEILRDTMTMNNNTERGNGDMFGRKGLEDSRTDPTVSSVSNENELL